MTEVVEATTFMAGDRVRYNEKLHRLLRAVDDTIDVNRDYIVLSVQPVPMTNLDPFSPDYQGEQSGQDAVGHHQLITLDDWQGKVSGAMLTLVSQ